VAIPEREWAERLNSLPKYVVSSTLEYPTWNNSTVLKGDVVREVSKLKQRISGDIVVNASGQLAHTLMEHDLVDELRLMIYPFVLGAGEHLFGRRVTTSPCAWWTSGPSVTASPSSPTNPRDA
jgi:dihydrofolate reductase